MPVRCLKWLGLILALWLGGCALRIMGPDPANSIHSVQPKASQVECQTVLGWCCEHYLLMGLCLGLLLAAFLFRQGGKRPWARLASSLSPLATRRAFLVRLRFLRRELHRLIWLANGPNRTPRPWPPKRGPRRPPPRKNL